MSSKYNLTDALSESKTIMMSETWYDTFSKPGNETEIMGAIDEAINPFTISTMGINSTGIGESLPKEIIDWFLGVQCAVSGPQIMNQSELIEVDVGITCNISEPIPISFSEPLLPPVSIEDPLDSDEAYYATFEEEEEPAEQ